MPSRPRLLAPILVVLLLATSSSVTLAADSTAEAPRSAGRAWDRAAENATVRLVVTFRRGTSAAAADRLDVGNGTVVQMDRPARRSIVRVARAEASATRRRLEADPSVASVQVSHRLYRDADPTGETYWNQLWGMHNTGQTVFGSKGVADNDVDALQTLKIADGAGVTVAVIDDGVDFSQPDLAGRAWTNEGEFGDDGIENGLDKQNNGIDDDANGFTDDVHGWDFCHDEPTVHDAGEDFHGTHVAGTIGASLNGTGVVGVAPGVSIMALKFLGDGVDAWGDPVCGWDDQAAAAIAYAKSFGVKVSNNSWGRSASPNPADDQLLRDAIANSGMLFITSAGNAGRNNDTSPLRSIPASFNLANILTVAAIDNRGALADFSNYGATSVDISAPGVGIVSTVPAYNPPGAQPAWPAGYLGMDGTSMAAPHVTGVAALIGAASPGLLASPTGLKARILATGKSRPGTTGLTLTGRIADALFGIDTVKPLGQAPNSYAFVNGTIAGSSITTRVRWTAGTDALSGVGSYALRQSVNNAAWTTVTAGTTALSVDRSLAINTSYRYRVRPQDRAGNAGEYADGPLVKPTLVQGTSGSLTYGGTWATASSSSASGGSTRYSTRAGASVSYTFSGRAVAVVAPRSSSRGSVRVYVDGALTDTVSTYRSSGQNRVVIFGKNWSAVGTHTIKLVVVGTSGHPRFDLDAFAVLK